MVCEPGNCKMRALHQESNSPVECENGGRRPIRRSLNPSKTMRFRGKKMNKNYIMEVESTEFAN